MGQRVVRLDHGIEAVCEGQIDLLELLNEDAPDDGCPAPPADPAAPPTSDA